MINTNYHSLNLFRGIAGYGVAICHFYYYLYGLNDFQFFSIFFVEFFFVLSGFVLYPQLINVFNNTKNLKVFFMRRWIRTLPSYVIALILYSIIFKKFDFDTIKYLFFAQNITQNFLIYDYFSIAWSLSVEEYFYIIFPLLIIFFRKFSFLNISILFIFTIYLIKIIYLLLISNPEFYRIGTFLRLDSIAFGVLTRIFYPIIKNNFINYISLFLSILLLFYFKNLQTITNEYLFFYILLLQIFSINLIIIFLNFDFLIKSIFIIKFFHIIANQTYSVYLFHLLIIYLLKPFSNTPFLFFYYLFFLFSFSTIFYYFFEKNINKLRPIYKY